MMFSLGLLILALGQQGQTIPPTPPVQKPATQTTTEQTAASQAGQSAQNPQGQAANVAPAPNPMATVFVKPLTVNQLGRMALTPDIDGKIDAEEWDPFASENGVDTYFQWEPEKLHFAAAHVPAGQDLIISIDGHGDSWLVGRDNLEVRVHWQGNEPQVTERLLDNTPVSGPVWSDASNFRASTKFAGSTDNTGHTVEISIDDPETGTFPTASGHTVGVRFDVVPETTAPAEPLLPRVMSPTRTQYARGEDVPPGLSWKPEVPQRSVIPGESTKLRLTFNGTDELGLKRIDMRTEGLAQNDTISTGVPFPSFDKKGRAFVDYKTKITREATLGYRIMKATITDATGKSSTLETSYEIAPVVSFDFHDKNVAASSEPQFVKFSAFVQSHTDRRVDGVFRVQVPEGWKVKTGNDVSFLIYDARGSKRQVFEVMIPGGFKGTAPIKLIADFAGSHSEQEEYIVVQ